MVWGQRVCVVMWITLEECGGMWTEGVCGNVDHPGGCGGMGTEGVCGNVDHPGGVWWYVDRGCVW